jgi:hypothetical protein
MRVVVHEDRVEVVEPQELTFGYDSLSARLAQTPEDDWPDAVDAHFRRAIELVTADSSELDRPTEDILDHVYQRLMPSDMEFLPDYSFTVAPGLVWTLAFDRPDSITILDDAHVKQHGIDRLSEAGIANLCREVPEQVAVGEGGIHILEGSDHVGSLMLVTPWLTELICEEPEPPYGVLVGAPNRNVTIFHLVRDGLETRYAIGEIARLTAEFHDDNSHPLSRVVHWWRPGRLEPIARVDGPELRTHVPDELNALMLDLS